MYIHKPVLTKRCRDYVLPDPYAGPKLTLLPDSTVNSTHIKATFRCQVYHLMPVQCFVTYSLDPLELHSMGGWVHGLGRSNCFPVDRIRGIIPRQSL